MKYLHKRDSFIKEYKKINEKFEMGMGRGPGANDINWGDSLVGRLINSFRRKVGIGANLVRINQVIKQLKRNFEDIIAYSKANALSEDDKTKIANVMIYESIIMINSAIVYQVNKGFASEGEGGPSAKEETGSDSGQKIKTNIEDKNYLNEVYSMITDSISQIKEFSKKGFKSENESEIISYLNEVSKKVEDMKSSFTEETEGQDQGQAQGEGQSQAQGEGQDQGQAQGEGQAQAQGEVQDQVDIETRKNYNNNFKSVAQILIEYDRMKRSSKAPEKEEPKKEEPKKELKRPGQEIQKEPEEVVVNDKEKSNVLESHIFETATSPILIPLKKMYNTFIQIESSAIKDLELFLKMSEEEQLGKSQRNITNGISKVYNYIRSKQGISESKINEDINVILSREKSIGDVILGLYSISKQKPNGDFGGISESMQKALSSFNSTMLDCLSPKKKGKIEPEEEEENKNISRFVDSKSTKLHRYSDFIKEELDFGKEMEPNTKDPDFGKDPNDNDNVDAKWESYDDNGKEIMVSEVTLKTQKPILTRYWTNIFNKNLKSLIITEKEANRLNQEFNNIDIIEDDETGLTIYGGLDPVLGILKCFNRAYKLHTTQVIPTGRSGGKVSNKTFREYTAFGGGSMESAGKDGGPYRNNTIFNKWESSVLDLISQREFQIIFDKNTKLQIGDKVKPEAGPIIRKMITDLLDGDTLYRSNQSSGGDKNGGAQKVFLDKYFGELTNVDKIEPEDLSYSTGGGAIAELEENSSNADDMPNPDNLSFNKVSLKSFKSLKDTKGSIFKINNTISTSSKEGTPEQIYFYVNEVEDNNSILIYSNQFGKFNSYVQNYANKEGKVFKGLKESKLNIDGKIYLTKISNITLKNLLNGSKNALKLNGINTDGKKVEIVLNPSNNSEFLLKKSESEEKPKIFKLDKIYSSPKDVKGFEESDISNAPETK